MIHVSYPREIGERRGLAEKLLPLVFAVCARDRASWLRLDHRPGSPGVRMSYCVPPAVHEMVPPPEHLWRDLVRTFLRHARLPKAGRPTWWQRVRGSVPFPAGPVFGVLPVQFGEVVHELDILFFRGPTGEHIWVEARQTLPAVDEFLRRGARP